MMYCVANPTTSSSLVERFEASVAKTRLEASVATTRLFRESDSLDTARALLKQTQHAHVVDAINVRLTPYIPDPLPKTFHMDQSFQAFVGTMLGDCLAIHCFSSRFMTKLMSWRNSYQDVPTKPTTFKQLLAVSTRVATEVCLPFVALAATIETAVYAPLRLVARALKPITTWPFDFVGKHNIFGMQSSSLFTIQWALLTMAGNPFDKKLAADEFEARRVLKPRT